MIMIYFDYVVMVGEESALWRYSAASYQGRVSAAWICIHDIFLIL